MFRSMTTFTRKALPFFILSALLIFEDIGQAGEWPQYRGPNRDGTTSEKIALTQWPQEGPTQLWKVPTPTGFSSFSIAKGKAFTLISRKDPDGVQREVCLALDADTGKEVWSQMLCMSKYDGGGDSGAEDNRGGDGPRSTPSTDGKRVYVYDSRISFYCFDIEDGKVFWEKNIEEEFEGRNIRWQSAASPLIEGDLVCIPGGGPDGSFLAFNKADGELVWKSGDELMTHATPMPATIHGVRQIIFFAQSGLVSLEAKTGKELWRFPHPYKTSTASSPVVYGDLVYCSVGYGVGAALWRITESNGKFEAKQVWRKPKELMNHWSMPICKDGYLYGMFSFKDYGEGPMKCVELETGEEKWSQSGYGPGNCILAGELLLVLADDGHLALVEPTPEKYKEIARAKVLDGKCWSTPVLSDGRIYARSTTEAVCLDVSAPSSK